MSDEQRFAQLERQAAVLQKRLQEVYQILLEIKNEEAPVEKKEPVVFNEVDLCKPGHVCELYFAFPVLESSDTPEQYIQVKKIPEPDPVQKTCNMSKLLSHLPIREVANPVAAITNYCRHHLKFEVLFETKEEPSENPSEPFYHIFVMVPGGRLLGDCKHKRKKYAKEQAARAAIAQLWDNSGLVETLANRFFK